MSEDEKAELMQRREVKHLKTCSVLVKWKDRYYYWFNRDFGWPNRNVYNRQ